MKHKARMLLSNRSSPGANPLQKAGGLGYGRPSEKLLRGYLMPPERTILLAPGAVWDAPLASRTAEKVNAGISKQVEAWLALLIMTGDYTGARKFASNKGMPEKMLIEEVRKFCQSLISESKCIDPELALEGFPGVVKIAKEFGLKEEKEGAVLEWCRLLIDAGKHLTAGRIAGTELSRETLREFTKERLASTAWIDELPVSLQKKK